VEALEPTCGVFQTTQRHTPSITQLLEAHYSQLVLGTLMALHQQHGNLAMERHKLEHGSAWGIALLRLERLIT
jgi:hypothetical protein